MTSRRLLQQALQQQQQQELRKARGDAITSARKYQCPKCEKSFSQSYSMYRHFRYECDSLPRYQCPYCGHVSKWSHSIYNHIRKIHPGQEVTLNKLYQSRGTRVLRYINQTHNICDAILSTLARVHSEESEKCFSFFKSFSTYRKSKYSSKERFNNVLRCNDDYSIIHQMIRLFEN